MSTCVRKREKPNEAIFWYLAFKGRILLIYNYLLTYLQTVLMTFHRFDIQSFFFLCP